MSRYSADGRVYGVCREVSRSPQGIDSQGPGGRDMVKALEMGTMKGAED